VIDFIECFGKIYRTDISRVTCFDVLINNITNGLCGVATTNSFFETKLVSIERTVPIIMAGCIAHARTGRISTSGEKSDVTIMFIDPDFLKDAKIFNSATNNGYIANFSLHMRKTAVFPLPVWNLTSPSCSSTAISVKTRKFRRFAYI